MKSSYLFCLFLFAVMTNSIGQNSNSPLPETETSFKNIVFVEALGNGLFGSINYERQLTKEPGLSVRTGIGFYTEDDFYLTLPVSLQYLINLGSQNYIETGLGYTWAASSDDGFFDDSNSSSNRDLHNLFFSLGYRKHFATDWMWKVNITPLITNNNDVTLPWLGIAIGKRF